MRNTGANRQTLLNKSTEEIPLEIDAAAKKVGGGIGEVTAPVPVPVLRPAMS